MPIFDNPLVAMRYDEALGRQLAERARERAPDGDFESILRNEQFEFKRDIISELARPINRTNEQTRSESAPINKGRGEKAKSDDVKNLPIPVKQSPPLICNGA